MQSFTLNYFQAIGHTEILQYKRQDTQDMRSQHSKRQFQQAFGSFQYTTVLRCHPTKVKQYVIIFMTILIVDDKILIVVTKIKKPVKWK